MKRRKEPTPVERFRPVLFARQRRIRAMEKALMGQKLIDGHVPFAGMSDEEGEAYENELHRSFARLMKARYRDADDLRRVAS